jgi:DNA-binding beta-propeller fold protein YncE
MARWTRLGLLAASAAALLAAGCGFDQPAQPAITKDKPAAYVAIPKEEGKTAAGDTTVSDQATQRLWLSDTLTNQIDVFDIGANPARFVTKIGPLNDIPLGLTVAPDLHRLYAGINDRSLQIIDIDPASPTRDQIVGQISSNDIDKAINAILPQGASQPKGPIDLIEYDAADHRIFAGDPDDGYLLDIDPTTKAVKAIGGGPRGSDPLGFLGQPRYDSRDRMVYVASGDFNQILKVDPATDKVLQVVTVDVTCSPHGMAISPKTNQGLIGCQDRQESRVLVWDFTSNSYVDSFDLSGSGDTVVYDPKVDQFFFAANNYVPSELSIFTGSPQISYVTSVLTSHKSKMVAYDEAHDLLYTLDGLAREAGLWAFHNPTVASH